MYLVEGLEPEDIVDSGKLISILANQATKHRITRKDIFLISYDTQEVKIFLSEDRYSSITFHGIIPDTRAAGILIRGIQIRFHIVLANTLFLFCLQDIDRMNVRLDNFNNQLWEHLWIILDQTKEVFAFNYLTETKVKQLHRRFGHPFVRKLYKLLIKEATLYIVDEGTSYGAAGFLRNFRSNFFFKEFRQNARTITIDVKQVPVKAYNSVGKVERAYA
ncbi:hypothetical protein DL98DRAFT_554085 [Cadophora sp. DSE1049]|nr:hypothetical protein DL98DRAFT_554085 [Cadophora sp. DSE1049]